eukprot:110177-Prorocentrum_minimum.AAC.4
MTRGRRAKNPTWCVINMLMVVPVGAIYTVFSEGSVSKAEFRLLSSNRHNAHHGLGGFGSTKGVSLPHSNTFLTGAPRSGSSVSASHHSLSKDSSSSIPSSTERGLAEYPKVSPIELLQSPTPVAFVMYVRLRAVPKWDNRTLEPALPHADDAPPALDEGTRLLRERRSSPLVLPRSGDAVIVRCAGDVGCDDRKVRWGWSQERTL